jgi:hypothetical protein
MRSLVAILLLVGSVGCAGSPPRLETRPDGAVGVETGRQLGDRVKRVLTKQPPETLVAEDGAVCRVSPDRYAATSVGDRIRCDWQPGAPVQR